MVNLNHMMLDTEFNDLARLEDNSHLLKPPINNYCVYNENVTVMVNASSSG